MAKRSRKRKSSLGSTLRTLMSVLATLLTSAGLGGWAFPEMPLVGSLVQRVLAATEAPDGKASEDPLVDLAERVVTAAAERVGTNAPGEAAGDVHVAPTSHLQSATPGSPAARPDGQLVSASVTYNPAPSDVISIASYNIQVFGESKIKKSHVMNYLVQIVRRFDLVAVQEIRSQSDAIMPDFVQMINSDGHRYEYVVGPRLGRTNSKEQYAYIYNSDRIEVDPRSVMTIDDRADALHREPLIARFRARTPDPAQGFTFWLINAHTDPDEVPEEVEALTTVFQSVQQQGWGEDDVVMLGDFNASDQQLGRFRTLPGSQCAIVGITTNTRGTKQYDNIVFDGRATIEFTGQAGVGNVAQHFGLTVDQALEISDHLPVWATFSVYENARSPGLIARQPGTTAR